MNKISCKNSTIPRNDIIACFIFLYQNWLIMVVGPDAKYIPVISNDTDQPPYTLHLSSMRYEKVKKFRIFKRWTINHKCYATFRPNDEEWTQWEGRRGLDQNNFRNLKKQDRFTIVVLFEENCSGYNIPFCLLF